MGTKKQESKPAIKSGWKEAVTDWAVWNPETDGNTLEGIYRESRIVKGAQGDFNSYVVETADGTRFAVSGANLDQKFPQIPVNTEVSITFEGTERLSSGRTMKSYTVLYREPDLGL